MNYIGSKRTLLPAIKPFLLKVKAEVGETRTPRLLDVFSGTGIVAQFGRLRGFDAVGCDLQEYARVTTQALILDPPATLIGNADTPLEAKRPSLGLVEGIPLRRLEQIFARLESLSAAPDHPFVAAYCEGGESGRLYLSAENGARVAAARDEIEAMWKRGQLDDATHNLLVASLLEGIDRVANTASVYGAYLKQVKKSARAPFRFALPYLVARSLPSGRALRGDANLLVRDLAESGEMFDLAYIDPPYNARLYASNYHLLETLARWDLDTFTPRGKTGLRPSDEGASDYCSKRGVRGAVLDLLQNLPARAILFSYSDEALIPHDELVALMQQAGFPDPQTTAVQNYKRFRADSDSESRVYTGDTVTEYLIFARRG